MKSNFSILFTSVLSLFLVVSCNHDNIVNENLAQNEELELNIQNKLLESTSEVSSIFLNMGVTEINVTNMTTSKIYSFVDKKSFYINGESVNLSKYEIVLENNMIHLNTNDNLNLSIKNNKPYIVSDSYVGFPNDRFYNSIDFNILLLTMNELITEVELKFDSNDFLLSKDSARCSFWNTYYVYGTGASQSVAQANLTAEIEDYSSDLAGCTEIGSSNNGCLWEEFGCIS